MRSSASSLDIVPVRPLILLASALTWAAMALISPFCRKGVGRVVVVVVVVVVAVVAVVVVVAKL